jgi:hypothetical protein
MVASAALASVFGVSTGCAPSTLPSPTPTSTPVSGSACPPLEQELCCTPAQLQACEQQGANLFAQAIGQCAGVCSTTPTLSPTPTPSPQCRACVQSVAHQSLEAYHACTATSCLALVNELPPAPATPTPTALRPTTVLSAPIEDRGILPSPFTELAPSTAGAKFCFHEELVNCLKDRGDELDRCLEACAPPKCLLIHPIGGPGCVVCAHLCFVNYVGDVADCLRDFGCYPLIGHFCTKENVCCPLGEVGCDDMCCAPGQVCCGKTCCPANPGCSATGQCQCQAAGGSGVLCNGTCCTSPFRCVPDNDGVLGCFPPLS